MTTKLMEQAVQSSNGDRYWERPWEEPTDKEEIGASVKESIDRVLALEGRRLEAQVKCGLELWRAKLNLRHTGWYPYLWRCCMSQPTASRRKDKATQFLKWAGIQEEREKTGMKHVIDGLELIHSKPFILNDFQNQLFELNSDSIRNSLQEAAGGSPPRTVSLKSLLGFDLQKVLTGMRAVDLFQHTWCEDERREVMEAFEILAQRSQQMVVYMKEYQAVKEGNFEQLGNEHLEHEKG